MVGAALIGRDVTARKQLDEVRANLAAIVSSSDDAIFGTTLEGRSRAGTSAPSGYTAIGPRRWSARTGAAGPARRVAGLRG